MDVTTLILRALAALRAVIPLRWLAVLAAAALLLAGCWWHGRSRYRAGVTAERAAWEQTAARTQAVADKKAQVRQQQKDTAEAADTARRIEYRDRIVPIREEVIRYVTANPDSACIAAGDIGRMLDRAIDAANATAAADDAAARR